MGLGRGVHVPYMKVVAGALVSPRQEISNTGGGREASLFQSSWDLNPGPCLLSPGSSHCSSVEASSSHWHNSPQRAAQKTHNGIFEQLPKDSFQIFSHFSLVMGSSVWLLG